ncbi:M15 family metallopeptidase [Niallia taxi]|uniref:M15 family metallopeptidase n=1 Tax=Niallia taxi TaxID=2499688 RepID=UPI00399D3368
MKKTPKRKRRNVASFLLVCLILSIFVIAYWKEEQKIDQQQDTPMPTELNETVAKKRDELISLAADKGINIVITADFRSSEEQDKLYAQGRTASGDVVTNAKGGESYHNYGLAIDFALMNLNGEVIWDMDYDGNGNAKSDWSEVVEIAKSLGFEWGGDWRSFKDYPHFQMDFGLSIKELQNGERP